MSGSLLVKALQVSRNLARRAVAAVYSRVSPARFKVREEMRHWRWRKGVEGTLSNAHYREVFTSAFGLPLEFYAGKRLLDVGCGPRGSLEWATVARERVGSDPLADEYLKLGAAQHAMRYVKTPAEAMPFAGGAFDVVSSFNSLDHVDDVRRTVSEIARVTRPGGSVLLLVEVNHPPTPTEPQTLGWDVVDAFAPWFRVEDERRYECSDARGIYDSLRNAVPYDASRGEHKAILLARFTRR